MKALVLLSGGLDSTTCLYMARQEFTQVQAIIFDYSQRHSHEITQAIKIAQESNTPHTLCTLHIPGIKSALTSSAIPVPKDRPTDKEEIPITYVPGRNTIFLAIGASLCESLDFTHLVIGANDIDYSGYPDCRPEFFHAFNSLLKVNSVTGITGSPICIYTPLLQKTKAQIIQEASSLNAPLHLSTSCYDPVGFYKEQVIHCGHCDSCLIRKQGFLQAQVNDPTIYQKET